MPVRALRPAIVRALLALALALGAARAHANPVVTIEVDTGRVVHHEDAFRRWAPASLTKLMTALVAFREIEAGRATLETPVVMSARAAGQPASKMYWKPGTSVTLGEAIHLLMVKSANDVASAVAETIGGTEARFVEMMNAEARRLGMDATVFRNPHGLPDAAQVTTARDMALLGAAIRRDFPQYDPIFRVEAVDTGAGQPILSYNLMLGRFPGADGMKTGFVCASGFNIITTATRGPRTVLTVVLGAPSQERRAEIAAAQMEAGFSDPLDGPAIDALVPYGESGAVANLRAQICNAEAAAKRYDGRDVEGRMVLDTDLITPRNRAPVTVDISPFPPLPEPREKPAELRARAALDADGALDADAGEPGAAVGDGPSGSGAPGGAGVAAGGEAGTASARAQRDAMPPPRPRTTSAEGPR